VGHSIRVQQYSGRSGSITVIGRSRTAWNMRSSNAIFSFSLWWLALARFISLIISKPTALLSFYRAWNVRAQQQELQVSLTKISSAGDRDIDSFCCSSTALNLSSSPVQCSPVQSSPATAELSETKYRISITKAALLYPQPTHSLPPGGRETVYFLPS